MDELNNYVVIGLDNYNDMRDELAVSRSIITTLEQALTEKNDLVNQLSNQIMLLQEAIVDDADEDSMEKAG